MHSGSAFEYCWYEQDLLALALEHAEEYDIIHSHLTPGAYSLSSIPGIGQKILHTLHSPVHSDIKWFFMRHPEVWLTTVSKFQLEELGTPSPKWRVIPNGLAINRFHYEPHPKDALMFMGRMEEQKGADLAVSVARELGKRLTLAGPILDKSLFASKIEPYLDENIRYVGVLDHDEKAARLANSSCVLMPSRWQEPFGMVAIEAMACGTPVVGLANGALPDIIEHGLTGYVTTDQQKLPELVEAAQRLDRSLVRARTAERFDIHGVAEHYGSLYEEIHLSYGF
jgi:glycosyltransferase involved in cell wall biosynthesis